MDKIPNGQNTELDKIRTDKILNWTKSQMDKILNWTKSRIEPPSKTENVRISIVYSLLADKHEFKRIAGQFDKETYNFNFY